MANKICVVLNSQHQKRVDHFVERSKSSAGDQTLFQPYFTKHLTRLHELTTPVPIYLVVGNYGASAVVVGQLMKVEYGDEVPRGALEPLKELLPVTDTKIDRTNLLYLEHGRCLHTPISLNQYRKISDGKPLRRGKWPAVVCRLPNGIPGGVDSLKQNTSDDIESAFEGHLRVLFRRHRQREHRLRTAKIRAVLRSNGRLKCEVAACSFDFEHVYGILGHEYAVVHHLVPLAALDAPRSTRLRDFALVCQNCHAMIHRGGTCRTLAEISASIRAARPE